MRCCRSLGTRRLHLDLLTGLRAAASGRHTAGAQAGSTERWLVLITAAACVLRQLSRQAVVYHRGASQSAAQRSLIGGQRHSLGTLAAHACDSLYGITCHIRAAAVGHWHTGCSRCPQSRDPLADHSPASLHSMQLCSDVAVRTEAMHATLAASAASSRQKGRKQTQRRSQSVCRSMHSHCGCPHSLTKRRRSHADPQSATAAPRALAVAPAPQVGRMASSNPADGLHQNRLFGNRPCRHACCCHCAGRVWQRQSRTPAGQRSDSRAEIALGAPDGARARLGVAVGGAAPRSCMRRPAGSALRHRRWRLVERVPGAVACCQPLRSSPVPQGNNHLEPSMKIAGALLHAQVGSAPYVCRP